MRAQPIVRTFAAAARATYGNNLVFLGAPGVGKGTFANRISPILGVPAISTGDIIRAEIKAGSELGKQCKAYTDTGKLVPDEVVSAMVRKRLQEADAQAGWILVRAAAPFFSACVPLPPPTPTPAHATHRAPHAPRHRTATLAPWGKQRTWTLRKR